MGLLIMRLVAGTGLIAREILTLQSEPPVATRMAAGLGIAAGVLLVAGLLTPFAGTLGALLALWYSIALHRDPWTHVLLGTLGLALALLGPGAWSVDARLYGWKRIDLPKPRSNGKRPRE